MKKLLIVKIKDTSNNILDTFEIVTRKQELPSVEDMILGGFYTLEKYDSINFILSYDTPDGEVTSKPLHI